MRLSVFCTEGPCAERIDGPKCRKKGNKPLSIFSVRTKKQSRKFHEKINYFFAIPAAPLRQRLRREIQGTSFDSTRRSGIIGVVGRKGCARLNGKSGMIGFLCEDGAWGNSFN